MPAVAAAPRRVQRLRGFALRALTISALAVAFASSIQATAAQAAPLTGAGNLPGCLSGSLSDPRPYMQKFHARLLRVVVSPAYDGGHALPCISTARAEGYEVMLAIQWPSRWSVRSVQSFFFQELSLYGRYLNAVGVGNEQEVVQPATSPAQYVKVWRAVEPMIKRMTPRALRVGGEISPWGLNDLKRELRLGLPGIQALSVHTYTFAFGFSFRQALALARGYRLPLWCDEGLRDGKDSWPSVSRTLTVNAMRGAAMVAVWDRNGAAPPSFLHKH